MNISIHELQNCCINTDDLFQDIEKTLIHNKKENVLNHSKGVYEKGKELSIKFDNNIHKIKVASYLHDISCIIPNENKIEYSNLFNMEILEEEQLFPLLLHQKLSKEIAQRIYKIDDSEILNSISCHTTLKANPTKLDMILFISDKISWDQENFPPYFEYVEKSLINSLEEGINTYLNYIVENKEKMKIKKLHPWFLSAYESFKKYK